MALKLTHELNTGNSGEYWKVSAINLPMNGRAVVRVSLYKNEAARRAGKQAIQTVEQNFTDGFTTSDLDATNPMKIAYTKLKGTTVKNRLGIEMVSFLGAEDC